MFQDGIIAGSEPNSSESARGDSRNFGHGLRGDFAFDKDWRNLNHGSFGTFPRPVAERMRFIRAETEREIDHFMLYKYNDYLERSTAALSEFLNVPKETLVFVSNPTTGFNTVLQNIVFQEGDHVVYFDTIYGACEKSILYMTEIKPVKATKISVVYPVSDDWLVEALRETVRSVRDAGERVALVTFDSIVSNPGVRVPFERLTKLCKELGVLSLVDAAQGIGHIRLNIGSVEPDFLLTSCHKWLFVPRPCAVLYVPVRNQHLIRSTIPTSHGFKPLSSPGQQTPIPSSGKSAWQTNFDFVGTLDNTSYYCVPEALKYRESLGGEAAIQEYCFKLARDSGSAMAEILCTEVLENEQRSLGECCFANVRLPLDLKKLRTENLNGQAQEGPLTEQQVTATAKAWLSQRLIHDHHTLVPMFYHGGSVWTRISAQVYLEKSDFVWLAETLKGLCARFTNGEGWKD